MKKFNFKPHLFREKIDTLEAGETIQDCIDKIDEKYSREFLVVKLDNEIVYPASYSKPFDDGELYIYFIPHGGRDGKKNVWATVAMIALTAFTAGSSSTWGLKLVGHAGRTARFVGGLVAAGVTYVGSLLVNAVFPPSTEQESVDNSGEASILSIQGAQNQLKPYAPALVLYGTHKITPNFAAPPYSMNFGDDNYLYMIFDCGIGEVDIEEMKFGEDKFLNSYSDVIVKEHRDLHTTGKLEIYTNSVHQESYSLAIKKEEDPVIVTSEIDVDGVNFDISFPRGLVSYGDTGNRQNQTVELLVEYKKSSDTTWLPMTEAERFTASNADLKMGDYTKYIMYIPELTEDHMLPVKTPGLALDSNFNNTYSWKWGWKKGTTEIYIGLRYNDEAGHYYFDQNLAMAAASDRGNTIYINGQSYEINTIEVIHFMPVGEHDNQYWAYKVILKTGLTTDIEVEEFDTFARSPFNSFDKLYCKNYYKLPNVQTDKMLGNKYYTEALNTHTPNAGNYCSYTTVLWGSKSSTKPVSETAKYSITRNTSQNFSIGLDMRFNERSQYDIRLTRVTADNYTTEGAVANTKLANDTTLSSLRSIRNEDPLQLDHQRTIIEMRIKATDQLSGVVDDFNFIGHRLLKEYNGTTWSGLQRTSNPSWEIYQVLTGEEAPKPIPPSRIDLDSFKEFSDWCEQLNSNGDTKYTSNIVVDYDTTIKELVNNIASVARATVTLVDGKYAIIIDREKTRVALVTPRNSWDFSSTRTFIDKPHALRTTYIDKELDYTSNEILVYNDGYNENNTTEIQDYNTFATTNYTQAWQSGRYILAQGLHRSLITSFKMDVENVVFTRGDMFELQNDVIRSGGTSVRVLSSTVGTGITNIVIDDEIQGVPTGMILRLSDGSLLNADCTVINSNTLQAPSEITGIVPHDLMVYGIKDSVTNQYIVKSITPSTDLTATIEAVDYAPQIFTADTAVIPPYDAKMSYTKNTPPGKVIDLTSTQVTQYKDRQPYVSVALNWSDGEGTSPSSYEIYIKEGDRFTLHDVTKSSPYYLINSERLDKLSLVDENLEVKVVAVGAMGSKNGLEAVDTLEIAVLKDTEAPLPTTGLVLSKRGSEHYLSWDKNIEIDLDGYEIRRGTTFSNAQVLDSVDRNTTEFRIGVGTDKIISNYYVRAFDTSENYSDPSQITLNSVPPTIKKVDIHIGAGLFNINVITTKGTLDISTVICYTTSVYSPLYIGPSTQFSIRNFNTGDITLKFKVIDEIGEGSNIIEETMHVIFDGNYIEYTMSPTYSFSNVTNNGAGSYTLPTTQSTTTTDQAAIYPTTGDAGGSFITDVDLITSSSITMTLETLNFLDCVVQFAIIPTSGPENTKTFTTVTSYHSSEILSQAPWFRYIEPEKILRNPTYNYNSIKVTDSEAVVSEIEFKQRVSGAQSTYLLTDVKLFAREESETVDVNVLASDVDGTIITYSYIYLSVISGNSYYPTKPVITINNAATGDYWENTYGDTHPTGMRIKVFNSAGVRKDASITYIKTGLRTSKVIT